MPQSKRQTDDVGERLKFKSRIKDKLSEALSPPATPKDETTLFHLPSDYEKLTESELMYTLIHNPELAHSNESAALAVNMLYGRASAPNVRFELVDLPNPVEVPEFIDLRPATRKPSKTAPGFARSVDSLPERIAKEVVKKQQFKQALADKIKQKIETEPVIPKKKVKVLQLPANYTELSEADLHYALVNSPQLKHSHESALLAIDIINGKAVRDTALQVTDFIAQKTLPKTENKRISKPKIVTPKDVTTVTKEADKVFVLPPNYLELPESKLGLELAHNPEFKYTPEEAFYILDILYNRIPEPEGVGFALYEPKAPENVSLPKLAEESELLELKVPTSYRYFGAKDLHEMLLNTPELGHTEETAALTVKIVTGGVRPTNVILQPVDVEVKIPLRIPELLKDSTPETVQSSAKEVITDRDSAEIVRVLPTNYRELPEAGLFKLLKNQAEFKHTQPDAYDTLDIVFGRKEQPDNMRFELIQYVEEVEPDINEPAPKEQKLVRGNKGQLFWVDIDVVDLPDPFPDPDPLPLPDPVPPIPEPVPDPVPAPEPEPIPRIDE